MMFILIIFLTATCTSLKLLKLRDIAEMQLPAKFIRGTQVWLICILQILKMLVTENETDHFTLGYLFAFILL